LGYTVEEYGKLDLTERLPPESIHLTQSIMQNELLPVVRGERVNNGESIIYEMLHRHKNGKFIWGEISFSFIRDNNGKVISILGITRNIDSRKRVETELARSKEYFKVLVENSSDWVWEIDKENVFTYCNPAAEKILGYPVNRIIGQDAYGFFEPGTSDGIKSQIGQFKKDGSPFNNIKWVLIDINQRPVYLEVNGFPFFDDYGNYLGYKGIARDVSAHEVELKKLHRLEKKHKGLLRQTDLGVIEVDNNFEILEWNAGATRIFGYTRGEAMVDKIFSSLWSPDSWDSFIKLLKINSHPAEKPFIINQSNNIHQDTRAFNCKWYINPVVEGGSLKRIMILAVDLTDVNEHKQAVNFHTMFFNALCQAVVFSDTSLKITGFSTSEANYFQPQADLQKGSFVRNLFTKEAAKVILNQGIKMVARTGYWKEQVKLNSGNGDKTVSLEIIHLLNAKGTLKGFAFLFERNLDVSVATERL
jgi:PAS domain S-box-containing protein